MTSTKDNRVYFIDELRGVLIIYVVIYHLLYDIGLFSPTVESWLFSDTIQMIRICCTGALIFISGISCLYSHSNFQRGIKTLGIGMVITLFTYLLAPQEIILFGIMHFFGVSMIIYALCERILKRIPTLIGILISGFLFLILFRIYYSEISLFGFVLAQFPETFRLHPFLFFLGIFPNSVYSADYYPLFPWIFLFLCGSFTGRIIKEKKAPSLFYKKHSNFLTLAGQHTMIIYLIHQPVLYGLVQLLNL